MNMSWQREERSSFRTIRVRHEASILRWAQMERDGNTDGSLDDVIAQLSYPLPVVS